MTVFAPCFIEFKQMLGRVIQIVLNHIGIIGFSIGLRDHAPGRIKTKLFNNLVINAKNLPRIVMKKLDMKMWIGKVLTKFYVGKILDLVIAGVPDEVVEIVADFVDKVHLKKAIIAIDGEGDHALLLVLITAVKIKIVKKHTIISLFQCFYLAKVFIFMYNRHS